MSRRYRLKKKKTPLQELRKEAKKVNWRLWLITFISVVCIFGVYQLCVYLNFRPIVHIYAIAVCLLAIAFCVLNKGFSNRKLTLNDLPKEWDDGKKAAFLENRRRARYLLIPIIGILLTFAFDIIYLYYLDPIL